MPKKYTQRQNAILSFLSAPTVKDGIMRKSSYIAVLYEARAIVKRSEKTGKVIDTNASGSWAGALLYMILIDQIGKILTLKKNQRPNNPFTNPFKSTLWDFTKLDKKEINALYALRCSIAHSYGLYNDPKDKKDKNMRHFFEVDLSNDLIILPKKQWNGKHPINHKKYRPTKISLLKLGNMVEEINKKLLLELQKNNLKIKLNPSVNTILKDHFIYHKITHSEN